MLTQLLIIGAALFSIGLSIVLIKRNGVMILMGIELMLNSVNLNFVAFSKYDPVLLQGQMFALFIILIAAAEAAVGLAILLRVYSYFKTAELNEVNSLKG